MQDIIDHQPVDFWSHSIHTNILYAVVPSHTNTHLKQKHNSTNQHNENRKAPENITNSWLQVNTRLLSKSIPEVKGFIATTCVKQWLNVDTHCMTKHQLNSIILKYSNSVIRYLSHKSFRFPSLHSRWNAIHSAIVIKTSFNRYSALSWTLEHNIEGIECSSTT